MNRNRFVALGLTSLALLGVPAALTINQPQVVQASTGYASKTSHSITDSNSIGRMSVKSIKGYKAYYSGKFDSNELVVIATFTNKSNKSLDPGSFFMNHFSLHQYSNGSVHELNPQPVLNVEPSSYLAKLSRNGQDNVAPHSTKTVAFADSDEVRPMHKHQLITVKAVDHYAGKALATKYFRLPKVIRAEQYDDGVKLPKVASTAGSTYDKYIFVDLRDMYGKKYPKNRYVIISKKQDKELDKAIAKGNYYPSFMKKKLRGKYYTDAEVANFIEHHL